MKRPELLIENGDLAGRRFAVGENGLRLGRSSSNDVHIPDEELSRNHCFFETSGEDGIRITDLASANGTSVNGAMIGGDAVDLRIGDVIEVGSVMIRVVGDEPVPLAADGVIDLGFGGGDTIGAATESGAPVKKRSPLANVLWGVVALLFLAGIVIVLLGVGSEKKPVTQDMPAVEQKNELKELYYEKVDADSQKVFRYAMTLVNGNTLTAVVDDVPEEDRHLNKSVYLNDNAKARLEEILADPELKELDAEYTGPDSDPPVLKSRTLRIVWSREERTISCVNGVEPDAFARIREKLEAFSKNELGIWAMGHSRSQLIQLARESSEIADMKWEDREVEYGNCYAAVHAWKEALFYLETVNPKPKEFEKYQKCLKDAEEDLDQRYKDHRFAADRAINIADWLKAKEELQILIALVPDREDDRYREASAKLLDVEKRMNGK